MKLALSALTLGVASAATCPVIQQLQYYDDQCKGQHDDNNETYQPSAGCDKFGGKNDKMLWTISTGKTDDYPEAMMNDCTLRGHTVKFYSDINCETNSLVFEHTVKWGPENNCVQEGRESRWLTEIVWDKSWIQEQERKESSDDDTPEHWKAVEKACKYDKQLEPECIEAWYHALDQDNGAEWLWMLQMWFNNQPWLALFGLPFSWFAGLSAWYFLFYPDRLPHIDDAPWADVKPIRGLMIKAVTDTANMMKPDAFFFSQIFTFGQSNLRDLELIFMDPFDAVLYFTIESFILPQMSVLSFLWVSAFWWLYLAEFTWWIVEVFFEIFIAEDDNDEQNKGKAKEFDELE